MSNKKIKYVDESYRSPMFPCQKVTSKIYDATGAMTEGNPTIDTLYRTPGQALDDMNDDFDTNFNARFFGSSGLDGNGLDSNDESKCKTACLGKSRYIHAPSRPLPNMAHGGFGTPGEFSTLRYGESSRQKNDSISDNEINRTHFTYRDYNSWRSFPQPVNSRANNKKTLNC